MNIDNLLNQTFYELANRLFWFIQTQMTILKDLKLVIINGKKLL